MSAQIDPIVRRDPQSLPTSRSRQIRPVPAPPTFSIGIELLSHHRSQAAKDLIFEERRTAIHSGKLGDIIYALPTCRALGINHLILNVYAPPEEPLRVFTHSAAKALVPLLLSQSYLREVSITKSSIPLEDANAISGVHYCFDHFRRIPRHVIGEVITRSPKFANYPSYDVPAHLGEHFAATTGIRSNLAEEWLQAAPLPLDKGAVVVSLTKNWRSYPDGYWKTLLKGLPRILFVGHFEEFNRAGVEGAEFVSTPDHLQLARVISGASLFVGTISFPYALAEALKTQRLVEVCHRNLNAFPIGAKGNVLPPDVLSAREMVACSLGFEKNHAYRIETRRMRKNLSLFFIRKTLSLSVATQPSNRSRIAYLRELLQRVYAALRGSR